MSKQDRTRDSISAVSPVDSAFWLTLVGGLGVWLSFPPAGLWWLAWIAPVAWVRLIQLPKLQGRNPQRNIYAAGVVHWLLMVQWVRLPHWSTAIGWFFLAAYLALFILAFVVLARALVHRARVSGLVAVPVSWVAVEYVRSVAFTGFPLVPLSNSQAELLPLVQLAGLTGAYGISFVIMLVASAIERFVRLPSDAGLPALKPLSAVTIVLLLIGITGYGMRQLKSSESGEVEHQASVAIIQGALDTVFPATQEEAVEVARQQDLAFADYYRMSVDTVGRSDVDLVVWPESMFRYGAREYDEGLAQEVSVPGATYADIADEWNHRASEVVRSIATNCLLGSETVRYQKDGSWLRYNSAILYGPNGRRVESYHKMHPVMFGEYIPFGEIFPVLYDITPIPGALARGKEAKTLAVEGVRFAPNICFENMVPHLIRRQVWDLNQRNQAPDVLVTLTNDGWFWGSSLLDVHLACGVFRSAEHRKPTLIAANTGFSAEVDRFGRVVQRGPRRQSGVLVATVSSTPNRPTLYTKWGDWFAQTCVGTALLLLFVSLFSKNKHKLP